MYHAVSKPVISDFRSPLGDLLLGSYHEDLVYCGWKQAKTRERIENRLTRHFGCPFEPGTSPVIEKAQIELQEYFDGGRRQFDLSFRLVGTAFQCQVWQDLLTIQYAATACYGDVASDIGRAQSVRAVAAAIGENPMMIMIPCHRVIARSGKLTGYAAGLSIKAALLDLEKHTANQSSDLL